MDPPPPPATDWAARARRGLVGVAVAGVLACLYVALALWDEWPGNPGWDAVVVDLGLLALATPGALWLALRGPRVLGLCAASALFVWGFMGTWLYGFLWVPGAAALLGCLLPRPRRRSTVPPVDGAHVTEGQAAGSAPSSRTTPRVRLP